MTDPNPPTADEPYDGPPAPAWVGELLAGLREDDPAIPAEVAARLDAALSAAGRSGSTGPANPVAEQGQPKSTVVPLASRRRTASSPWGHRLLLGGVAAAAVVVLAGLGTVAVLRGSSTTSDVPNPLAGTALTPPSAAPAAYVRSGQRYTASNLVPTTRALLSATARLDATDSPSQAPSTSSSAPPSESATPTPPVPEPTDASPSSTAGPVLALTSTQTRPSSLCLSQYLSSGQSEPIVVDEATYEQQPVYVVVVQSMDLGTGTPRAGSVDVWVVPRPCGTDASFLKFERVDR